MTANPNIKVRATVEKKIDNNCPPDCKGDWCDDCPFFFPQRPRKVPDARAQAGMVTIINPIYNYLKV